MSNAGNPRPDTSGPPEKVERQISKRLAEIDEEVERYVKVLGQGELSVARLEAQMGILEKDNENLQVELLECERKVNEAAIRDFNAVSLLKTLKDFRKVFST